MGRGRFRRNTRQREVILEELRKLASHPTAVGLYEIVRRRLPRISLGTVYRNLELLAADSLRCSNRNCQSAHCWNFSQTDCPNGPFAMLKTPPMQSFKCCRLDHENNSA